MRRTKVHADSRTQISINIRRGMHTNLLLHRSRKLERVAGRKWWDYLPKHHRILERLGEDRLTPDEVARMQAEEVDRSSDFERRSGDKPFTSEDLGRPPRKDDHPQLFAAGRVFQLLSRDSSIRRICNIGGRVDLATNALAREFPDREFVSIDFQSNLREINDLLPHRPNVEFVSGYALDLFEGGKVRGDLVFSTSTASLFLPRELERYCRAWRSMGARFVVMSESWHIPAGSYRFWRTPRPEDIDPYAPPLSLPHNLFLHNYPYFLEAAGYGVTTDLLSYQDVHYLLQVEATAEW